MSRELGMVTTEILALDNLGILVSEQGNLDQGGNYFMDGIALAREANYQYFLAALNNHMGENLMAKGAYSEALPFLLEALNLFQEIGHKGFLSNVIKHLAQWSWHNKRYGSNPARWLACALNQMERSGEVGTFFKDAELAAFSTELQADLGEDVFARAWSEGEQMSIEETLAEILIALPKEIGETSSS